jgi:hypothetical protein
MSKLSTMREFAHFMGRRKKFWLVPLVTLLALFGIILIFAEGSALAPFIYTLF